MNTPTTLEQDGFTDGIDFDDNDRFALDGQRLVCVAGTYGAAGSEYRTEIDSFVRVTAHGTATSGPDYFVVETKSGLKKTYGQSASSALIYDPNGSPHQGAKVTWLLEKIEDTNGNSIEFIYEQDSNSQAKYICEINFGASGHSSKIVFEYEERDDDIVSFLRGANFAVHQRLKAIRVFGGGIQVWAYTLAYDYSPQRPISRLRSVTYTDTATGDSMMTSFDWEDGDSNFTFDQAELWYGGESKSLPIEAQIDRHANNSFGDYIRPFDADFLDIDGDGLLERLSVSDLWESYSNPIHGNYDGKNISLLVADNTRSGFGNDTIVHNLIVPLFSDYHDRVSPQDSYIGEYETDLNIGQNSFKVELTNFAYDSDPLYFRGSYTNDILDVDGDGDLDLIKSRHFEATVRASNPSEDEYDFDLESALFVYKNEGGVFSTEPQKWAESSNAPQNFALWKNRGRSHLSKFIDMNGDGRPDRVDHGLYSSGSMKNPEDASPLGLHVSINTGNGLAPPELWLASSNVGLSYPHDTDDLGHVPSTLLDMNGDGLPDKVDNWNPESPLTAEEQGMWVSINTGTGFSPKQLWYQSNQNGQHYVRWKTDDGLSTRSMLIDLNGDGLVDKVDHRAFGPEGNLFGLWVSINNGDGFEDPDVWYRSEHHDAQNFPEWGNSDGIRSRFLDMNGDGLPDRVDHADYTANGHSYGMYVSINTGDGFAEKTLWFSSSESRQCMPRWENNSSHNPHVYSDLIDMNGDRLPDKLDHKNYATGVKGLWVSINNGTGFDPMRLLSSDQNLIRDFDGGGWPIRNLQPFSELKDINGDGFPDRIYSNNNIYVQLNGCKPPLLSKVTDNFGVSTQIAYKPLTDESVYARGQGDVTPPTITIQTPMRVVASTTKDSGTDGAPYVTEYTYAEGRYHTRGRGFLGFRVFESYDAQTQLTNTEILRHNFPYTGMKEASMTYGPNGQLLSRSVNTLNAKALNGGLTLYPYYEQSEEWKAEYDSTTNFSTMDEAALIAHLESNAYGHTTTTNDFDAHGNNLETFIDYGDGYTQLTENLYAYDNETTWFLGRLSSATVTSTAPDATGQTETIVRNSAFTYDSNGLLLTETVEPGDPLAVTTTYARDAQGRIVSTTVDPADGPAITTETHSQLDSTDRFYTQTANALGHSETRTYDPVRGWVTSQTGPNGRTTHFQYDALGRAVREDRPDGTWTETSYAYDSSVTVDTFGDGRAFQSVYKVTTTGSQAPTSVTWYDRLGRAIRSASEHFDGRMVYQDTGYNALGQADCVSENYFAGTSPQYWTKTTFDALGRPDVATAPDGTKAKTLYNGRETTSIRNYQGTDSINPNANDQTTKTLLNAKGDKQTVTSYNEAGQPLTIDYHYDGLGNLLETVTTSPSEGTRSISMSYDIRGNKTGMVDPDMGTWSYSYNALGQLVSQTDAVGNVTTKTYDALGRITEETYDAADTNIPTVTHNFYYDGTGEFQQIGKLHLEKTLEGGTETFRRSHHYDDLGRSFLTLSKIEGRWFYQQTDYDGFSRPVRLTHYWRPPSLDDGLHDHYLAWYSYSQETVYDDRSFVIEVKDAQGQTWFSDPIYNEHGQLESYVSGGATTTTTDFEAGTQLVERIRVDAIGSSAGPILDQTFQFDSVGNLTQRTKDSGTQLTENFTYDKLNRVLAAAVTGGETVTMAYDDFGNITSRSNSAGASGLGHVGSYAYTAGKNRVSSAGGRSFLYDDNGSITEINTGGNQGLITWTAFNKPAELATNDSKRSLFGYDSANARVSQTRQEWDAGQGTWLDKTRKTYVGALFEQEQAWNETGSKWDISSTRIYISSPAGVIGSWVSDASQTQPIKTLFHRDHLGSVVAQTDLAVTPAEITREFSYDAWGLRRDATDWTGAYTATAGDKTATDRGYTGHEMLDELGLVHMNGRIYDPLLGRMLSADPHIQSPTNLQNYNRYSYVTNNPLSMTDPSGFFFKKLFKSIKKFFKKYIVPIVTIAIAAAIMWWAPYASPILNGMLAGAVSGGVGAAMSGGNIFQGIAFGAIAGAAFGAIGKHLGDGHAFLDPDHIKKITAHGVTGEIMNQVRGGDFGYGFLAAGATQFAAPGIDNIGGGSDSWGAIGARVTAAAAVGGSVEEIAGGSFENGAVTGAFSRLFNDEAPKTANNAKMKKHLDSLAIDSDSTGEITWGNFRSKDSALINDYISLYRSSNIGLRLVYDAQIGLAATGDYLTISYGLESTFTPGGVSGFPHKISIGSPPGYTSGNKFVPFGSLESHVHELFHLRDYIGGSKQYYSWKRTPSDVWENQLEYRAVRATNAFRKEQGRGDLLRTRY